VLGIPWPFHQKYEEFNLRFYVTHQHGKEIRRGVVFLSEFVPNYGFTLMANVFAREKYRKYPMRHAIQANEEQVSAAYDFQVDGRWNSLSAVAEATEYKIIPGSLEDFIAEHYYGYNKRYGNRTLELQLKRPAWKYQKLLSFKVDCKFEDSIPRNLSPSFMKSPIRCNL